MIVVRWTWNTKKTGELVKALMSWPEYGLPRPAHAGRIYSPTPLGSWGMVTWEQEFESVAEYDVWVKEWTGAPRWREWHNAWYNDLCDRGGGGEVWNVKPFD